MNARALIMILILVIVRCDIYAAFPVHCDRNKSEFHFRRSEQHANFSVKRSTRILPSKNINEFHHASLNSFLILAGAVLFMSLGFLAINAGGGIGGAAFIVMGLVLLVPALALGLYAMIAGAPRRGWALATLSIIGLLGLAYLAQR